MDSLATLMIYATLRAAWIWRTSPRTQRRDSLGGRLQRQWEVAWEPPDKKANYVAPIVSTAWREAVYRRTTNAPVVPDARTGEDRETTPGLTPWRQRARRSRQPTGCQWRGEALPRHGLTRARPSQPWMLPAPMWRPSSHPSGAVSSSVRSVGAGRCNRHRSGRSAPCRRSSASEG